MKLGELMKREREKRGLSLEATSDALFVGAEDYRRLEAGTAAVEEWGPLLARIAIELGVPTSRLLAESGKAADTVRGQAARLIAAARVRSGRSIEDLASSLHLSVEAYREIEEGRSPIEELGPLLLRFAELIEEPVFNLFYPGGVALEELEVDTGTD